ncbi:MAG: hypothetical protein K8R56_00960 [Candidatus Eisenbacteria bacterium]|nr:hypothetical protein [Candidatus Eisenbacteria bacterium]
MLGRRKRVVVEATAITPGANRRLVRVGEDSRELVPMPSSPNEPLVWRQPTVMAGTWWLESSNGAHVLFQIPGSMFRSSRVCTVEAVSGSWRLHLDWGFARDSVIMRDSQDALVASFKEGYFGSGKFVLADETQLPWRSLWLRNELIDTDGVLAIGVKPNWVWLRDEADVTVAPEFVGRADLPALLTLAWYASLDPRRRQS